MPIKYGSGSESYVDIFDVIDKKYFKTFKNFFQKFLAPDSQHCTVVHSREKGVYSEYGVRTKTC